MIKAVRGTRDLLPPDTALWNFVESKAREVFARYNYQEIRTPVFESTELFARGVGEETDIVSKEMFTWEDKARAASEKSQSLTLRPENTAGVVRAYIEHNLEKSGLLQKLYYLGPQFRRERPQKGRYRQFYQIGAEIIGPPSAGSELPIRDAEVLDMLVALLDAVGLTGWTLYLNSVGCSNCRPAYNEALRKALADVKDQMCADCQRRAETNPLRVLDCKVPEDQPIIEALPKIADYLDEPCREHFAQVKAMLDELGVPYQVNERMVRGLDYYTRTTFEFTHGELGAQSAVLGGGRYDGLSEQLGGPRAPGIGFAIGEDRLVLALQAQQKKAEFALRALIVPLGKSMNRHALKLAKQLREAGVAVDVSDESFRLKKSFETAEKLGARYAVLVGENEVTSGEFAVKNLASSEQTKVARGSLAELLVRPTRIYTDTNVLRYFATAFANTSLPENLQAQILLAPLALMELISQLATNGADEAFAAIHSLLRVYNAGATGILPGSDDLFRISLFNLPPSEDVITPALNKAVINILNAAKAEDLKEDAEELRALLDREKDRKAKDFSALLTSWRAVGPLAEADHQAIFARSIARRAGIEQASVNVEFIVNRLDALYRFEKRRMQVGARNDNYNVSEHSNDLYDAELLIYLADPTLHLLTSDKGFLRASESSQFKRIHIVDPACLLDPDRACEIIRSIAENSTT